MRGMLTAGVDTDSPVPRAVTHDVGTCEVVGTARVPTGAYPAKSGRRTTGEQ